MSFWVRRFYLQLSLFYLLFVFFGYGGGTVSEIDQIQSNRFSTLSNKDQTEFQPK